MLVAPAAGKHALPRPLHGSMLAICVVPGCGTLTLGGGTCVAHDDPVTAVFPRGRPFVPALEQKALALITRR